MSGDGRISEEFANEEARAQDSAGEKEELCGEEEASDAGAENGF